MLADVGDRLTVGYPIEHSEAGQGRAGASVSAGTGDLDALGLVACPSSRSASLVAVGSDGSQKSGVQSRDILLNRDAVTELMETLDAAPGNYVAVVVVPMRPAEILEFHAVAKHRVDRAQDRVTDSHCRLLRLSPASDPAVAS